MAFLDILYSILRFPLFTGYLDGIDAVEKLFVIAYMLFFSILLFAFEAIELRQIEWIDHLFRRNFGFLYGALGKAFFIIL